MKFYKYHGTGNDFILFDGMDQNDELIFTQEQIAHLCHRRFGIGADGLMIMKHSAVADFEMVYYNSDGNLSSMCGNGGRCISKFFFDLGYGTDSVSFIAIDGMHEATLKNGNIQLKMSDVPNVDVRSNQVYVLNTGSPHYVSFTPNTNDLQSIFAFGKSIRYNAEFESVGINVNLVVSQEPNSIRMATYERGVEDETYSCGTGVVAASISQVLKEDLQQKNHIKVLTKGGELSVNLERNGRSFNNIYLNGPAKFVFSGDIVMLP